MTVALLLVVAAYMLGAVPASHWTGLWFFGKDLRTLGSGNLGATNVQRVLGWGAAIPVGLFDIFKGFAPAFWFPLVNGQEAAWWGVVYAGAAIVGHCCSLWVRFRGGKGVATSGGALFALAPTAALAGIAVWIATLLVVRKVSVASMAAAAGVAAAGFVLVDGADAALRTFLILMAAFVIWAHRSNIRRLIAGEEPSIGGGSGAGGRGDGQGRSDRDPA